MTVPPIPISVLAIAAFREICQRTGEVPFKTLVLRVTGNEHYWGCATHRHCPVTAPLVVHIHEDERDVDTLVRGILGDEVIT